MMPTPVQNQRAIDPHILAQALGTLGVQFGQQTFLVPRIEVKWLIWYQRPLIMPLWLSMLPVVSLVFLLKQNSRASRNSFTGVGSVVPRKEGLVTPA